MFSTEMCRSIKTLRGVTPASEAEVEAAALQFVRKISGFREPSSANEAAFRAAVREITGSSERLLQRLPPKRARPAAGGSEARNDRDAVPREAGRRRGPPRGEGSRRG